MMLIEDKTFAFLIRHTKVVVALSRPFTLFPSVIGTFAGFVRAVGIKAHSDDVPLLETLEGIHFHKLLCGLVAALFLSAASNMYNQVCDLDIDKINKPKRPLPSGEISIEVTQLYSLVLFALTAYISLFLVNPAFFCMLAIAMIATVGYSSHITRWKSNAWKAQICIAISRGFALQMCGGYIVFDNFFAEQMRDVWILSIVFTMFIFGASATKDFADIQGDKDGGCETWPILYGSEGAARFISPFLLVPWLLVGFFSYVGLLTCNQLLIGLTCVMLVFYAVEAIRSMLSDPSALCTIENHPSWMYMYLILVIAQVGTSVAYLV